MAAHGNSNRQTVTIFRLLDSQISSALGSLAGNLIVPLKPDANLDGFFISFPSEPQPPSWQESLTILLPRTADLDLRTQRPGGLIFVQLAANSAFILTFGTAWTKIDRLWVDVDFGRRVVLNCTPPDQLTEVKSEQVFAGWHLAYERAPIPAKVEKFNVEADRDLVHAVEGKPDKKSAKVIGQKVSGGTSLTASVDFTKLREALEFIEDAQLRTTYLRAHSKLNSLRPVNDPDTCTDLDNLLDAALSQANSRASMVMSVPVTRYADDRMPSSYWVGRIRRSKKAGPATEPFLSFDSWTRELKRKGHPPSLATARTTRVHTFDEKNEEIAQYSVLECLGFETFLPNGKTGQLYVLSGGVWWQPSVDLITDIGTTLSTLPAASHRLLKWNGEHEGDYNRACAASGSGLLLFDARNVYFGGGQNKFEFCDLYDPVSRTLYFVKHIGASSHMSHLAEQVRRTTELFFSTDQAFRSALIQYTAKYHPTLTWPSGRPRQNDYTLCLVSMGIDHRKFPLFAKCGLAKLVKDLVRANYNVSFAHV